MLEITPIRLSAEDLVREAAHALVTRLDEMDASDELQGVFSLAYIHGVQYNGPNWGQPLRALKEALAQLNASAPKQEGL